MKKLILSAIALTVAGLASAQSNTYSGNYNGIVRFNGEVIDQTCVVKTDKKAQTIVLEKVAVGELQGAGKVAGNKQFQISLEGCKTNSAHQLVRAQFISSPHVDLATGTLKNTKTGQPDSASNVNLRLKESNGTPIKLGDAAYAGHVYHNLNGQATGEIQYSVEYYATGTASVGKVESEVEYAIVYQ